MPDVDCIGAIDVKLSKPQPLTLPVILSTFPSLTPLGFYIRVPAVKLVCTNLKRENIAYISLFNSSSQQGICKFTERIYSALK